MDPPPPHRKPNPNNSYEGGRQERTYLGQDLDFDPIPLSFTAQQQHLTTHQQSNAALPTQISVYSGSGSSVTSEMTSNTVSKKRSNSASDNTKNIWDFPQPEIHRSVNHFATEIELLEALLSSAPLEDATAAAPLLRDIADGQPVQKVARYGESRVADNLIATTDWILPIFDPQTTEPQCVTTEVQRLSVLKQYLVLDSQRDQAFDRITQLATRIFDAPIALISLIDLGRQWFLSNQGLLEGVVEMPRKMAFCARECCCCCCCLFYYLLVCYYSSQP